MTLAIFGREFSNALGSPDADELMTGVVKRLSPESSQPFDEVVAHLSASNVRPAGLAPTVDEVLKILRFVEHARNVGLPVKLMEGTPADSIASIRTEIDRAVAELLVSPAVRRTDILLPIFAACREAALTIVSANLDRILEDSAVTEDVPIRRGFPQSGESEELFSVFTDDLDFRQSPGINLIKLRGSIDWWEYNVSYAAYRGLYRAFYTGDPDTVFHDFRSRSAVRFREGCSYAQRALYQRLWGKAFDEVPRIDRIIIAGYSLDQLDINHLVRRFTARTDAIAEVVAVGQRTVQLRDSEDLLFPIGCQAYWAGPITVESLVVALTEPVEHMAELHYQ